MVREDSGKSTHEINCLKQTALKKLLKNPKGVKLSVNNFDYKISYKGETIILRNHPKNDVNGKLFKRLFGKEFDREHFTFSRGRIYLLEEPKEEYEKREKEFFKDVKYEKFNFGGDDTFYLIRSGSIFDDNDRIFDVDFIEKNRKSNKGLYDRIITAWMEKQRLGR